MGVASTARAQLSGLGPSYDPNDPFLIPDAPAPPTIADLTHRAWALSVELTGASVQPLREPDGTQPPDVGVFIGRVEAEAAVASRRWYIGMAEQLAVGRALSGDASATLISNPEVWGRALWASRAGLAYGGGLGIVLPIVPQDAEEGLSVRNTVRVVRPWDYPQFAGRVFTFRPFIDVRSIDGPVMLQLRQGIDVVAQAGDTAIPDTQLTSRTTFYIGYRPVEALGLGLELFEVYFIKAPGVPDDQRASFAVSPSVRWMTPVAQPALSFLAPVDEPLFHQAEGYWAVRLNVGLVLDPHSPNERPTIAPGARAP